MTTVEDQWKLAVPLSSITETLFYNHRLLVDSYLYNEDSEPRAWLISKVNRISPKGICVVTMAQDIFDQHNDYIERDSEGNIIGMWANYFNSNVEPTAISQEEVTYLSSITSTITCSGKNQIKVGGSPKTFTITYYDVNNRELPAFTVGTWSFEIDGEDATDILTIDYSDDNRKAKVTFNGGDDYIGKVLTVINNNFNGIVSYVEVEIVAL